MRLAGRILAELSAPGLRCRASVVSTSAMTALEKAFEEIKQLKDELYRENLALKEEIDQASMFEEIVGTFSCLSFWAPQPRNIFRALCRFWLTRTSYVISGYRKSAY
jgi:hypothetical protein